MWADLAPLGRSASTGGYFRQPWHAAEREARAWFAEQAAARGLRLVTDAVGNQVAWWDVPGGSSGRPGDAVLTGSHLDSVLDGGAFDGPLGVVSALAAVDRLRERGVAPTRPLGVSVFVEEEGSRFGLACLGSRLATGEVALEDALARRDRDGTSLEDALAAADLGGGSRDGQAVPGLLDLSGVGCFVELHVEQGRHLVDTDAAVGLASRIWPHGRYRFDVTGRADHAGATRMEDRHDPLLTFSMTALAANKQARLAGQRATFGRLDVAPNATNAIPSRVTGWLDARADSDEALAALVEAITAQAAARAERDGTALSVTPESVSQAVAFDADLTARLGRVGARTGTGAGSGGWPVLPSLAGHDAGILAAAGVPTAMMFVRNPTGVSHAPDERAETADCLTGVEALADVLAELVS
ncbi:allantoate amidohydrolase [Nocardioides sp. GY 10127]|nr:allantoate amidohydrolase [Nocardioides sp. GY 10127]